MKTEQTQEKWQVEAHGRIFDTDFAEMTKWIDEGVLLRQDKVRKGNLRWIEAAKVPSLLSVFNAKDSGQPLPAPVITTTKLAPTTIPGNSTQNPPNYSNPPQAAAASPDSVCSVHSDRPATYVCSTCMSAFCKVCPNSYGGTVKICPYCGALCNPLAQPAVAAGGSTYRPVSHSGAGEPFGLGDLVSAFAYPFQFKTSLILGAIMFALFSLGQSVVGFGGIYMLSSAIFCWMLANTLTFGVLSNTVENMAQGKLGLNFMPTFEDFSIWDDVFEPFFLMIGVNIASFGPLAILMIVAVFFVASNVPGPGKSMNGAQSDAARLIDPNLPNTGSTIDRGQALRDIIQKKNAEQQQRIAGMDDREIQPDVSRQGAVKDPEEQDFDRLNKMIQEQRKAQLESAVGKAPDTVAAERMALIKKLLGYGVLFLLLGGVFALWGVFYYPAACAVAGYTHSFGATLNPLVGLDTIRRLGIDYVKILLMCLVIAVFSGVVFGGLSLLFIAFDMPGVGNLPAKFVGSLFGFYFAVVFAVVIGSALYKAADRLELPGA